MLASHLITFAAAVVSFVVVLLHPAESLHRALCEPADSSRSACNNILILVKDAYAGGPKKRRAVKLTGETRVFEEGQIGEVRLYAA